MARIARRIPGIGDLAEDIESQALRKDRKGIEPRATVPPEMNMGVKIKRMNAKEKLR